MNLTDNMELLKAEALIQRVCEWHDWVDKIPYIKWPSDWLVKAIPPFNGAIIRYLITKEGMDDSVSVYLDCYDRLGRFGEPYWEVYPHDDDVFRCKMEDTDSLLGAIEESLVEVE